MNYLQRYGTQLIQNGYKIIPISKGLKYPKNLSGWQQTKATPALVDQWISSGYTGIGILTATCPAVDLDIQDKEIVDKMLEIVIDICGISLRRVGLPPKLLLPYQVDGAFFRKVNGPSFTSPDGKTHKVEILASGQQFVAYGEHPDTKEPYTWISRHHLADIPISKLPSLNRNQGLELVEAFKELIQRERPEWKLATPSSLAGQTGQTVQTPTHPSPTDEFSAIIDTDDIEDKVDLFATYRPKLALTDEQIQNAIEDLDSDTADDYSSWVTVGMALWHQTDGSEWGFQLWDTWSQKSGKYEDSDGYMRKKWASFKTIDGVIPITFATIRGWANRARMRQDPLGGFLQRYVYVQEGDKVHDLEGFPSAKDPKMTEFSHMQAPHRMEIEIPAPTLREPDRMRTKIVPVVSQWMINPDRFSAHGYEYIPNRDGGRGAGDGPGSIGRMRQDEKGHFWVNTFYMPDFPPVSHSDMERDLQVYFEHMHYLFPIEQEREWFMSWMAFNLQFPEIRCKVTPLHISSQHGTGRGWIVELMEMLLGHWNCSKTKMGNLVGEGNGGAFNEFLFRTLFCSIEEVHEGSKPYQVGDQIRDVLTEKRLSINVKHEQKGTFNVYTNMFMMSNHVDALRLEEEDRRINVFITKEAVRSREYYNRIYRWLIDRHSAGPAALWHWLLQRDLKEFNWQTPLSTEGRDNMIKFGRSDVSGLFHTFVREADIFVITYSDLIAGMQKYSETMKEFEGVSGEFMTNFGKIQSQIRRILQQEGTMKNRLTIDGKKESIWILDRKLRSSSQSLNVEDPAELKKLCFESREKIEKM